MKLDHLIVIGTLSALGLCRMGMAATTLELKAPTSEAFNDLKSVDQRMLIMEMWNWYQPNSEKLMTLMATLDQKLNFMCRQLRKRSDGGRGRQQLSIEEMMSTCSIPPHEAENLIKKIDGFESRLMALESRSASTYFPEAEQRSNGRWKSHQEIDATKGRTTTRSTTEINPSQQGAAEAEVMSMPALRTTKSLSSSQWDATEHTDAEIITTTTTFSTTTPERLFCPPDYHQVGKSCYAIAFFQALGFHEAAEQCKSQSGGHLATFEEIDKFERLKQFLQHHVVENIHPFESVSFWIGATTSPHEDGSLIWVTTSDSQVNLAQYHTCDLGYPLQQESAEAQASALIERDEKCYSITWNAPRNCSFDLEATHCGRSLRYICEAQGENA